MLSLGKRGAIDEIFFFIAELLLIGLVFVSLLSFVGTQTDGRFAEMSVLSKDTAMIKNTVYSVPGDVSLSYTGGNIDMKEYNILMERNYVTVGQGAGTAKAYYPNLINRDVTEYSELEYGAPEKLDYKKSGRYFQIAEEIEMNPLELRCPDINTNDDMTGKTIILDPGHGGSDTGHIALNGFVESNINHNIVQGIKALLPSATITRGPTQEKTEDERLDLIDLDTDVFISIHIGKHDSVPIIAYVDPEDKISRKLACDILNEITSSAGFDVSFVQIRASDSPLLRKNSQGAAVMLELVDIDQFDFSQGTAELSSMISKGVERYYE